MRNWFEALSGKHLVAVCLMLGGIAGLGFYTFVYANGFSYLSKSADSEACANCHVMHTTYESWQKSGHRHVASCGDCHMPNNSVVTKWAAKSYNGVKHAVAFTMGDWPEALEITDFNREVAVLNCVRCHERVVSGMAKVGTAEQSDCLSCHQGVWH